MPTTSVPIVGDAIKNAVAFDECKVCENRIAWVDANKSPGGGFTGGSWIHVHLPESVHVAVPLKGRTHAEAGPARGAALATPAARPATHQPDTEGEPK